MVTGPPLLVARGNPAPKYKKLAIENFIGKHMNTTCAFLFLRDFH